MRSSGEDRSKFPVNPLSLGPEKSEGGELWSLLVWICSAIKVLDTTDNWVTITQNEIILRLMHIGDMIFERCYAVAQWCGWIGEMVSTKPSFLSRYIIDRSKQSCLLYPKLQILPVSLVTFLSVVVLRKNISHFYVKQTGLPQQLWWRISNSWTKCSLERCDHDMGWPNWGCSRSWGI